MGMEYKCFLNESNTNCPIDYWDTMERISFTLSNTLSLAGIENSKCGQYDWGNRFFNFICSNTCRFRQPHVAGDCNTRQCRTRPSACASLHRAQIFLLVQHHGAAPGLVLKARLGPQNSDLVGGYDAHRPSPDYVWPWSVYFLYQSHLHQKRKPSQFALNSPEILADQWFIYYSFQMSKTLYYLRR